MNRLTVLLVDDHDGFLNAAMRHFRNVGWLEVVGRAMNGLEAIAQTEQLKPAVVLTVEGGKFKYKATVAP